MTEKHNLMDDDDFLATLTPATRLWVGTKEVGDMPSFDDLDELVENAMYASRAFTTRWFNGYIKKRFNAMWRIERLPKTDAVFTAKGWEPVKIDGYRLIDGGDRVRIVDFPGCDEHAAVMCALSFLQGVNATYGDYWEQWDEIATRYVPVRRKRALLDAKEEGTA